MLHYSLSLRYSLLNQCDYLPEITGEVTEWKSPRNGKVHEMLCQGTVHVRENSVILELLWRDNKIFLFYRLL